MTNCDRLSPSLISVELAQIHQVSMNIERLRLSFIDIREGSGSDKGCPPQPKFIGGRDLATRLRRECLPAGVRHLPVVKCPGIPGSAQGGYLLWMPHHTSSPSHATASATSTIPVARLPAAPPRYVYSCLSHDYYWRTITVKDQ